MLATRRKRQGNNAFLPQHTCLGHNRLEQVGDLSAYDQAGRFAARDEGPFVINAVGQADIRA